MTIQILCDNEYSWIVPYARMLVNDLKNLKHDVKLLHRHNEVVEGDILVLLSCERIFKALHLNQHNLVVHESLLPKGKGWSPMTWQVLEGKSVIPVTLFEAKESVDSGDIYDCINIQLDGTELIDELREKQAHATIKVVKEFVISYPNIKVRQQEGEESFYPKRRPQDSRLDSSKSIIEQINLLRVCDNERYPAYFEWNGQKFILKIYKSNE